MAKDDDKEKGKNQSDPDEEFFKEHGIEEDEDKKFLKAAHVKEKYLEHRRKLEEKSPKKKGGSLFGRRD